MVVQRADVLGDRHFVIVKDNQHVRLDVARMVHGFKGHTGGNGAVANDADGAALLVLFLGGNGNTDARRNGGGGVADAQHVILALTAPRERMQAAFLTNGANLIATSGQNFVRIGLVAHVQMS